MTQSFIYRGRLPSTNEQIYADRSHWAVGAALKKQHTEAVAWEAKAQKLKSVPSAKLTITFYEPTYKRDEDGVLFGLKYLLDGLVTANVIPNDTRKKCRLHINPIEVDKLNPRIEITIEEV